MKDGDTIGEGADEKIEVIYAVAFDGYISRVMRLVYIPKARKKSH